MMNINNMNPMIKMMIENAVGKDNFNNMLKQWNSMSPEQKQAELSKVGQMSPQQRNEYLLKNGINLNGVMDNATPQQPSVPQKNRFNY